MIRLRRHEYYIITEESIQNPLRYIGSTVFSQSCIKGSPAAILKELRSMVVEKIKRKEV